MSDRSGPMGPVDQGCATVARVEADAVDALFADDRWVDALRSATIPPPGGEIAGYRVVRVIQRGPQGTVYEGVEPATGRRVAVKRMPAPDADADSVARFERETRALARLEHPSIVRLLAAPAEAGSRIIVTEWIDGLPFDEWADGRWERESPSAAVRSIAGCARAVAAAIAAAHAAGVMHRDIKPSNVIVTADGTPKVLDFGLSKSLDANATHARTVGYAGTPAWSAPEQVAEHSGRVDARTDVHALGLLLYRGLCGRTAFDGTQPIARLFEDIRHAVPVEPRRIRGAIPREPSLVAMHAIEKEPARRYLSADAMALDLGRFLAGEAVAVHPPSAAYHARKFVRRHWATVLVASVTLVAVGAGISTAITARREARAERRRADERQAFIGQLVSEQAESQAAGRAGLPGDVVRRALAGLGERDLGPGEERSLRTQYAELLARLGADAEAVAEYRRVLSLLPHDAPASERAQLHRALAESCARGEDAVAAREAAEAWVDSCLHASVSPSVRAEALIALASAIARGNDLEGAMGALDRAGPFAAGSDDPSVIAWLTAVRAGVLERMGRDDEAVAAAESAVASLRGVGTAPGREARILRAASLALRRSRAPDAWARSAEWLRRAFEAQVREVGPRHPALLPSYLLLAESLDRSGRREEALETLREGEQRVVRGLPWPDARRADMQRWIAQVLLTTDDDESVMEAERRLGEAVEELVALGAAPERTALPLSLLLRCLVDHRGPVAAAEYASGLPGSAVIPGTDPVGTRHLRAMALDVLMRTDPPALAPDPRTESMLREDLADSRRMHGERSDEELVCESALARCLAAMGRDRRDEARALAVRAADGLRARHGMRRTWTRPAEALAESLGTR